MANAFSLDGVCCWKGDFFSGRERRESEKFILFFDCYNAMNLQRRGAFSWNFLRQQSIAHRTRVLCAAIGGVWHSSPGRSGLPSVPSSRDHAAIHHFS
jgi:hypothetical protein